MSSIANGNAVAVENEKLGVCVCGPVHVLYHVSQPFGPLGQSDVAVCFWYKMSDCIGSEFLDLTCLKMFWNKYTWIHP